MKIAFITEACSAGVGRHVIDAALVHARTGHKIHLLHSSRRIDARFATGLIRLTQAGGHVADFDMQHGLGPSDYFITKQLRRHLVQEGPFDVVHCHSTKAGLTGRVAALGLAARVIYTPHAFFSMSPDNGFVGRVAIRMLEASLALISDRIICVSEEELEHAKKLGIAPRKLCFVPNGIDDSEVNEAERRRTAIRQRFNLVEDSICIGFVGRLVAQKDPKLLVGAFLKSLGKLPQRVRLVLVGDGPLMPDLAEMVAASGARDRVLLAGESDGLHAMSAFDLLALPSRYEGFPYVLLEALAMGLPLVATACGGVRAMVSHGENGFVVPPGDMDGFALALARVALSQALRDRMAEASIRRSLRFSLSRMVTETERAYKPSTSEFIPELNQPVASRSPKSAVTD